MVGKHIILILCIFLVANATVEVQNKLEDVEIVFHPSTKTPSLLVFQSESMSSRDAYENIDTDSLIKKSLRLIDEYSAFYNITSKDMKFQKITENSIFHERVLLFQQMTHYEGKSIRVLGAQLAFIYNEDGSLRLISGTTIPNLYEFSPLRKKEEFDIDEIVTNHILDLYDSRVSNFLGKEQVIYQNSLSTSTPGIPVVAYLYEVKYQSNLNTSIPHRECELIIDSVTGDILSSRETKMNFRSELFMYNIHENRLHLKWKESYSSSKLDKQLIYSVANGTRSIYNMFMNLVGFKSFDGYDSTFVMNLVPMDICPNAYWDQREKAAYFCYDSALSMDIVVHEFAHGYVASYGGNLMYEGQSGALNEGYADIIGETVQLLLEETPKRRQSENCKDGGVYSTRWLLGDKSITSFGEKNIFNQLVAMRDMYAPGCYGHPESTFDINLWCTNNDNKGVHANSGIINKAYSLLVDGGYFNDNSIRGIGLEKAIMIYLRALGWNTPTTNFETHARLLQKACSDLSEAQYPVIDPITGEKLRDRRFSQDDCINLERALNATGLFLPMNCDKTAPTILSGPSPLFVPYNPNSDIKARVSFMTKNWDHEKKIRCYESVTSKYLEASFSVSTDSFACTTFDMPQVPYMNLSILYGDETVFGPYIIHTYERPQVVRVTPDKSLVRFPTLLTLETSNTSLLREFNGCSKSSRITSPADFSYDCLMCDFGFEKTRAYIVGGNLVQCLSPSTVFDGPRSLRLRLNRVDIGSNSIPFAVVNTSNPDPRPMSTWMIALISTMCALIGMGLGMLIAYPILKKRQTIPEELYFHNENEELLYQFDKETKRDKNGQPINLDADTSSNWFNTIIDGIQ